MGKGGLGRCRRCLEDAELDFERHFLLDDVELELGFGDGCLGEVDQGLGLADGLGQLGLVAGDHGRVHFRRRLGRFQLEEFFLELGERRLLAGEVAFGGEELGGVAPVERNCSLVGVVTEPCTIREADVAGCGPAVGALARGHGDHGALLVLRHRDEAGLNLHD